MKIFVTLIIIGVAVILLLQPNKLIGNKNTKVFHAPDCKFSQQIKHKKYFINYEDAVNYGYKPCKICKPTMARTQ